MMRVLGVVILVIVTAGWFGAAPAHAQVENVNVCHGEGNGGYHLISVSSKAVPAHLKHGDALPGECAIHSTSPVVDEFEVISGDEQINDCRADLLHLA
jgi:hypothetical protein